MSRLPQDWVPPVARAQAGVFTAAQAMAAGATVDQVRHRRESGAWITVAGAGLAAASVPTTEWVRAVAGMLTWPDAVVVLRTAALLHRLPVPDDGVVHLLTPSRRRGWNGLVSHRFGVEPPEVVARGPVRLTTLRRTLTDCIGRLPERESDRLVAWAATRELITARDLDDALASRPRTWGTTGRRRALRDLEQGTLGAAERRLRWILRRSGLTGWEFDQRIDDAKGIPGRADALHRDARVVIEVDGWEHHARDAFQADRTKQNRLVAAGYIVLRFTWADLHERPGEVARRIRQVLLARSAR